MNSLAARPLALAGPAVVVGIFLSDMLDLRAVALPIGGLLLAWVLRSRAAFLLGAAMLAGVGVGSRTRPPATLPRAPPPIARCELEVVRCGENTFDMRAWLMGRRRDGTGVLCAWPGRLPDMVAPGARVRIAGRFALPRGASNPGESDARTRLWERRVAWRADLRSANNIALVRAAPSGPGKWFARARRWASRRLAEGLSGDVSPVALALLLGERGGLDPADRRRFVRTGTMHLLAISGMHLLLLAGAVHGLLRGAGLGPRTASAITLALALGYVPLTGAAPPIRRAATVLVFYAVALVRGRTPDPWTALGGAALVLALRDPRDVFGIGFHLSFVAAAGILWLAGTWREAWSRRHRLLTRFPAVRRDRPVRSRAWGYVLGALPVAVAAWCATQALIAQAFGLATPWAPLINLLAAPFVAVALPALALFALGLGILAAPIMWLVRGLRTLLDAGTRLPGGCILVPLPSVAALLAWHLGALLLRVRWRLGVALLVAATATCWFAPQRGPPGLVLFDVGHGQAALLRFDDGGHVLVDAGSATRPHVGARILLPALRTLGVRRLDAIVCTHADADHWNALPELLDNLPVDTLWIGRDPPPVLAAAAARVGVPVRRAAAGDVLYAADWTSVRVVAGSDGLGSDNDTSLALLFRAGTRFIMLPADREEAGLARLQRAHVPRCDVLLAPHHGARCREARRFGRLVGARWLLVSAARGQADACTLRGYGASRVLQTWRNGCLTVGVLRSGGMQIGSFLYP